MARENHLWGAEKIQGKLLKLGIEVGKPTIQKYMKQVRRTMSGQSWSTFLRNHAREVWACDFTVTHGLLFRPIYSFVIIAHHSREIVHSAVTRHPTDAWVAQQLREATPWNRKPPGGFVSSCSSSPMNSTLNSRLGVSHSILTQRGFASLIRIVALLVRENHFHVARYHGSNGLNVSRSQIMTVPSVPAETRMFPPGENET